MFFRYINEDYIFFKEINVDEIFTICQIPSILVSPRRPASGFVYLNQSNNIFRDSFKHTDESFCPYLYRGGADLGQDLWWAADLGDLWWAAGVLLIQALFETPKNTRPSLDIRTPRTRLTYFST